MRRWISIRWFAVRCYMIIFCMTGMRKMHHINGMDFIMQKGV